MKNGYSMRELNDNIGHNNTILLSNYLSEVYVCR